MLNKETLFTKLEFAYIMNYYRLKVEFSNQRYADVICLNHSHSGAVFCTVFLFTFIIFQSFLQ